MSIVDQDSSGLIAKDIHAKLEARLAQESSSRQLLETKLTSFLTSHLADKTKWAQQMLHLKSEGSRTATIEDHIMMELVPFKAQLEKEQTAREATNKRLGAERAERLALEGALREWMTETRGIEQAILERVNEHMDTNLE